MQPTRFGRLLQVLIAVVLVGLLASCGAASNQWSEPASTSQGRAEDGSAAGGGAMPGQPVPEDEVRLIIRTQTLRFEVANTKDAIAAVREIADGQSAIVTNMRMANDDGYVYDSPASGAALRGWLTLRVPVDGIDALVASLAEVGELVYQAETSDDVTQEYVDVSARLENLRAQEQRLRELIAQAANVQETLAVEQELWRVRGEIESLDAQVKYLERQAAMATVTVELTEPGPVVSDWGFMRSIRDGVRAAVGVLGFLVTFLIASSPLWVLGIIIVTAIRRWRRRKREAAAAALLKQPPPVQTEVKAEPAPATIDEHKDVPSEQ